MALWETEPLSDRRELASVRLVRAGIAPDSFALAAWRQRAPSSGIQGPRRAITDRYTITLLPGRAESPEHLFARVRERVLAYAIYPPRFLLFAVSPPGSLTVGSTIVVRAQFGVVAIEAGARVFRVWDSPTEAGFAYVTLRGHPELGVESFRVLRDSGDTVRFVIEARSRPGEPLTLIGFPVARAIQVGLTRAALRRFARWST